MKREEGPETETTEEIVDRGRRGAMKKIAVGVGVLAGCSVLPDKWTRPIIGQIVLPAHAATSGSALHDPCTVELLGGDNTTASVIIKVTGFVTPPVANVPVTITATAVGGAGQKVESKTSTSAAGTFEAIMTVGGGPGITRVNVTTAATGADGVANCSVNTTVASSPSNVCSDSAVLGAWYARGTDLTHYPVVHFTLASGGAASNVTDGDDLARPNGTWSKNGNVLTIVFPWVEDSVTGTDTYVLTLNPDCSSTASGTVSVVASNGETGSMGAEGSKQGAS